MNIEQVVFFHGFHEAKTLQNAKTMRKDGGKLIADEVAD